MGLRTFFSKSMGFGQTHRTHAHKIPADKWTAVLTSLKIIKLQVWAKFFKGL